MRAYEIAALGFFFVAAAPDAVGCSYHEPKTFGEVLGAASSVAVVMVEELRLKHKGPRREVIDDTTVAEVRVAETVLGQPAQISAVEFSPGWCGGHHLDVGEYYLLALRDNVETMKLLSGDPSIVYLFGEYSELDGSAGSRSRLLMELRNFVRLGSFNVGFPIQQYLDHTRGRMPGPPG